ncbi:DUF4124 domain-containing protein [Roseateles sp.]|uniref:DUF4124 domain-containing protein n=1 Tax=Roseateles sp. TaxID=1971397 RepID=UPI00391B5ACC
MAAADSESMTRLSLAACRRPLTFLLLAGGLCGAVQAQYKCVDKRGAVSFQQLPCSNEERSQTLEVRPTNVAVPAATPNRSSGTQQASGSGTATAGAGGNSFKGKPCPTAAEMQKLEADAAKIRSGRSEPVEPGMESAAKLSQDLFKDLPRQVEDIKRACF